METRHNHRGNWPWQHYASGQGWRPVASAGFNSPRYQNAPKSATPVINVQRRPVQWSPENLTPRRLFYQAQVHSPLAPENNYITAKSNNSNNNPRMYYRMNTQRQESIAYPLGSSFAQCHTAAPSRNSPVARLSSSILTSDRRHSASFQRVYQVKRSCYSSGPDSTDLNSPSIGVLPIKRILLSAAESPVKQLPPPVVRGSLNPLAVFQLSPPPATIKEPPQKVGPKEDDLRHPFFRWAILRVCLASYKIGKRLKRKNGFLKRIKKEGYVGSALAMCISGKVPSILYLIAKRRYASTFLRNRRLQLRVTGHELLLLALLLSNVRRKRWWRRKTYTREVTDLPTASRPSLSSVARDLAPSSRSSSLVADNLHHQPGTLPLSARRAASLGRQPYRDETSNRVLLRTTAVHFRLISLASHTPASIRVLSNPLCLEVAVPEREIISNLKVGNIICRGTFGIVLAGKTREGVSVAIKLPAMQQVSGVSAGWSAEEIRSVCREIAAHRLIRHPAVVDYYGVTQVEDKIGIVMELLPRGNLFDILFDNVIGLSATARLNIAKDLTSALVHLHHSMDPPLVHRDVKTANVVLDHNFRAKLCDFGKTRIYENGRPSIILDENGGSPRYMAPESFWVGGVISCKTDIWSLGCCLIEIFGGPVPFEELPNNEAVVQRLLRDQKPPEVPQWFCPQIQHCVHRCLTWCPENRPNAIEVLAVLQNVTPRDICLYQMDRSSRIG